MFKLIVAAADDIRLDERGVSEMLTCACRRGAPLWVEGVAAETSRVFFICSDRPEAMGVPVYRLSRIEGDLAAALRMRYDSGFRTAGAFELEDGCWILTERVDDASADGNRRTSE